MQEYQEMKTYVHTKEERQVLAAIAREYRRRKKLAQAKEPDFSI